MAPSTRKTRSKAPIKTEAEAIAAPKIVSQKTPLAQDASNPPKLFVLPKETSPEARILTIANPKTSSPNRYFCCPEKGFYEFTKIAAPKTTPRSWLVASLEATNEEKPQKSKSNGQSKEQADDGSYIPSKGYITKTADLFVATPIDPLFLILPYLASPPPNKTSLPKRLFLAADDYFDALTAISPHLKTMLRDYPSLRARIEVRMAAICDTVDAGDDTMYRLNETKLVSELFSKAGKVVQHGIPASMEEKLVVKALEVPVLSLKRADTSTAHELADEEDAGTVDSRPSTETTATPVSGVSTPATSFSSVPENEKETEKEKETETETVIPANKISAPEGIPHLLRLSTAFSFILASYLPAHLCSTLNTLISSPPTTTTTTLLETSVPDFAPLDTHLAHLATLRATAAASRSLTDFSRKRLLDEEEEAVEARADKKRKLEEEKKKKASESRGVRDLRKVNVAGMKKMSDFFKKK